MSTQHTAIKKCPSSFIELLANISGVIWCPLHSPKKFPLLLCIACWLGVGIVDVLIQLYTTEAFFEKKADNMKKPQQPRRSRESRNDCYGAATSDKDDGHGMSLRRSTPENKGPDEISEFIA